MAGQEGKSAWFLKLPHHKNESRYGTGPLVFSIEPQEPLMEVLRLHCDVGHRIMVEHFGHTQASFPYMFMSSRGLCLGEIGALVEDEDVGGLGNSTFTQFFKGLQRKYGAPWDPIPPLQIRHIMATELHTGTVGRAALPDVEGLAQAMGHSTARQHKSYISKQARVQNAVRGMANWRQAMLQDVGRQAFQQAAAGFSQQQQQGQVGGSAGGAPRAAAEDDDDDDEHQGSGQLPKEMGVGAASERDGSSSQHESEELQGEVADDGCSKWWD